MVDELVEKAVEGYVFLRELSPKHELLKYFKINEKGFSINPRDEIIEEFLSKFRGYMPTTDIAIMMRMPFAVYKSMLISNIFRNYIYGLEEAIISIEMRN